MKKRVLSLFLVLCLALGMSVPAFATTSWTDALNSAAGGATNVKNYVLMLLNSATSSKNGIVTSADGSDVYTWQKWVSPSMMTALEAQISAVYNCYLVWENLSISDREAASYQVIILQDTLATFRNSVKAGLNTGSPENSSDPADPDPDPTPDPTTKLPFSDVKEGDWYYPFVSTVYEKKLFAGYEDGTFRPNNTMTYGEFLGVLAQFSRDTIDTSGAAVWYEPFVNWALKNQLIPSEIQEKFDPNANITRQDMAALIGALISAYEVDYTIVNSSPITFTDADKISSYAAGGVLICWQAGIMGGRTDGSFDSKSTATRAEVAVVMTQLARVMGK